MDEQEPKKPRPLSERQRQQIVDESKQTERYVKMINLFSTPEGGEVFQQIMELGRVHLPNIQYGMPVPPESELVANEAIRSFCIQLANIANKDVQQLMQKSIERINRIKGEK